MNTKLKIAEALTYRILARLLDNYVRLKNPVIIKYTKNKEFCRKVWATQASYEIKQPYMGFNMFHIITMAHVPNAEYIDTIEILAHELCHAIQMESTLYNDNDKTPLPHDAFFWQELEKIHIELNLKDIEEAKKEFVE